MVSDDPRQQSAVGSDKSGVPGPRLGRTYTADTAVCQIDECFGRSNFTVAFCFDHFAGAGAFVDGEVDTHVGFVLSLRSSLLLLDGRSLEDDFCECLDQQQDYAHPPRLYTPPAACAAPF